MCPEGRDSPPKPKPRPRPRLRAQGRHARRRLSVSVRGASPRPCRFLHSAGALPNGRAPSVSVASASVDRCRCRCGDGAVILMLPLPADAASRFSLESVCDPITPVSRTMAQRWKLTAACFSLSLSSSAAAARASERSRPRACPLVLGRLHIRLDMDAARPLFRLKCERARLRAGQDDRSPSPARSPAARAGCIPPLGSHVRRAQPAR